MSGDPQRRGCALLLSAMHKRVRERDYEEGGRWVPPLASHCLGAGYAFYTSSQGTKNSLLDKVKAGGG